MGDLLDSVMQRLHQYVLCPLGGHHWVPMHTPDGRWGWLCTQCRAWRD